MKTLRFAVVISLARTLDFVKGETTCPTGWKDRGWRISGFQVKTKCVKDCPDGLVEADLFGFKCRPASYNRKLPYVWSPGSSGQSKCEAAHGVGNCEKWGIIWYQKCRKGWYSEGCCSCKPNPILKCEEHYNLTSVGKKNPSACWKESM
jgi:hypothetical protein